MEIKKTSREIWIHHTTIVDEVPYYRNEYLTYDTNGILIRHKIEWVVGKEDGKGPYVEPSGPLDRSKKQTSKSLEKKFKSLSNK